MSNVDRPVVAITLGDPAGIGPEIVAKAFAAMAESNAAALTRCVVVGPLWAVRQGCEIAKRNLGTRVVEAAEAAHGARGVIDVIEVDHPGPELLLGEVSARSGHIAVKIIEHTARLAIAGDIAAMVTCPINKESVHAAGYHGDIGHQEILARLTGATNTATMLMTEGLRVAHLSTHKSLAEAVRFVRKDNVLIKARLTHQSMERWGIARPRIAVAALNPHGGEGGLLGYEEIEQLLPAIAALNAEGIDAVGPLPADSVFTRAINGEFDVVLALYHDQGHIAIKVHNFEDSVTVTMGIPFVRTSVDHGTAFDIAGKGVADHMGLLRAVETAEQIVARQLPRFAKRGT